MTRTIPLIGTFGGFLFALIFYGFLRGLHVCNAIMEAPAENPEFIFQQQA